MMGLVANCKAMKLNKNVVSVWSLETKECRLSSWQTGVWSEHSKKLTLNEVQRLWSTETMDDRRAWKWAFWYSQSKTWILPIAVGWNDQVRTYASHECQMENSSLTIHPKSRVAGWFARSWLHCLLIRIVTRAYKLSFHLWQVWRGNSLFSQPYVWSTWSSN